MGNKTILLVEDDAVVKNVIRISLEQEYDILEASTCSDVIKLVEKKMDLAIVDYHLPDGDGFEVSEMLRSNIPKLPIIFITGYSTEDLAIKALRAGVTEYIKKPMTMTCLGEKVSAILYGKLCKERPEDPESRDAFIMDGIAAYMEIHFREDLNRDVLAKLVRMDRYKLSKMFNEKFGSGIPAYLNSLRVRKAAELLRDSELRISEIAEYVGYRSLLHFDRVFKAAHNIAPSAFRELHKKSAEKQANGPRY